MTARPSGLNARIAELEIKVERLEAFIAESSRAAAAQQRAALLQRLRESPEKIAALKALLSAVESDGAQ